MYEPKKKFFRLVIFGAKKIRLVIFSAVKKSISQFQFKKKVDWSIFVQ